MNLDQTIPVTTLATVPSTATDDTAADTAPVPSGRPLTLPGDEHVQHQKPASSIPSGAKPAGGEPGGALQAEPAVSGGRRLKAKRRPPPEPRLFEHGDSRAQQRSTLSFHPDAHRAPHLLMRVGPRDLEHALVAVDAGAKPSALVTGMNEGATFTGTVRRACGVAAVDWACDPQLWKTALPGYRTSPQLQALDYTPGRDADPYTVEEFHDHDFLARIARAVVGDQFDIGANLPLSGAFLTRHAADPWLSVSAELLRLGIAHRDALGARPLLAVTPLDLGGFTTVPAQREVVSVLTANRPDAYLLMLSGLHTDSGPDRIVAALTLALLLQETGAPVILSRPGLLRHLFLAFGVRGIEFGLGRLSRFAIPDYSGKARGATETRFEFPSLLGALAPAEAMGVLGSGLLPETDCSCAACEQAGSLAERVSCAAEHDAHTVCASGVALEGVTPAERVALLRRSLGEASWNWEALRNAGVTQRIPAHLGRWRAAIDQAEHAGLLNPRMLARRIGLL
jgi:hypothetical protein